MAKLPGYKRLYSSDFDPEQKELIDSLGNAINPAIDAINDSLNKRLNFRDNISATIVEISITVDANGTPTRATSFKLDGRQTTLEGVMVIDASGTTDPTLLPNSGVFVSATKSENTIIIKNVKGLQPNQAYTLKIIALG